MDYRTPTVVDYGDLTDLTLASGIAGTEDGAGKTVQGGAPGIGEVSIGVLP